MKALHWIYIFPLLLTACSKFGFMGIETVPSASTQTQFRKTLAGQLTPVKLEVVPDEGAMGANICKGFTLNARASNGLLSGVASDLGFSLSSDHSGKFYEDDKCTKELSQQVLLKGFYAKRFYFKSGPLNVSGSASDSMKIVAATKYFPNSANIPSTFTAILSLVNVKPEAENAAPIIDEDTALSIQLKASDANSDTLAYEVTGNLTYAASSFNLSASGVLSYQPLLHFNGIDSIRYRVFDGRTYSDEKLVTIGVRSINDPPVVTAISSVNVTEDIAKTIDLSQFFADPDTDPAVNKGYSEELTYQVLTYPVVGTGTLSSSGTTRTFTPPTNSNTATSFEVQVQDKAGLTVSRTVAINIIAQNDPPTLTSVNDLPTINEDTTTAGFTLNTSNTNLADVDSANPGFKIESITAGSILRRNGIQVSAGDTFSQTDSMSWDPVANDFGTGKVAFSVRGWDGLAASASAVAVKININSENDVPKLITNSGLTVSEGGTNRVIDENLLLVTDDDSPPPASLTYTLSAIPTTGTLKRGTSTLGVGSTFTQNDVNSDLLKYNHDGSETTSDSFTFTVSDGQGGSIGSTNFNITINPVNDAPVADAKSDEILNTALANLTLSGSDADSSPSGFAYNVTPPLSSVGTVSQGSAPNKFIFDPAPSFLGTAIFTYTISDDFNPQATSAPATITVVVGDGLPRVMTNSTLQAGGVNPPSFSPIQTTNLFSKIYGVPTVPAANIIYTLDTNTPAQGALRLSTAPGTDLVSGSTFTQDDINSSRLRYYPNNSGNTDDFFDFTVHQLGQTQETAVTRFNINR